MLVSFFQPCSFSCVSVWGSITCWVFISLFSCIFCTIASESVMKMPKCRQKIWSNSQKSFFIPACGYFWYMQKSNVQIEGWKQVGRLSCHIVDTELSLFILPESFWFAHSTQQQQEIHVDWWGKSTFSFCREKVISSITDPNPYNSLPLCMLPGRQLSFLASL